MKITNEIRNYVSMKLRTISNGNITLGKKEEKLLEKYNKLMKDFSKTQKLHYEVVDKLRKELNDSLHRRYLYISQSGDNYEVFRESNNDLYIEILAKLSLSNNLKDVDKVIKEALNAIK